MILRCTGKLLTLLGERPSSLTERLPTDDDWYANLLWLDRRKCPLLVHGATLFPVFAADVRKAGPTPIGDVVARLIQNELRNEDLPAETFGRLDPGAVILAKTASRVVLGYMNEMARFCEYGVLADGGLEHCDARNLNRQLRRELHLSRQPPGYFLPIELVRAGKAGIAAPEQRPRLRVLS